MLRLCATALLGSALAACGTVGSGVEAQPPDAKAIILANKTSLWKDPDSIKDASIATSLRRHMGHMWFACIRLNAKNSFGGYVGSKTYIVLIYDSGKPPGLRDIAVGDDCHERTFEPFPQLQGDYRAAAKPPPKPAAGPAAGIAVPR